MSIFGKYAMAVLALAYFSGFCVEGKSANLLQNGEFEGEYQKVTDKEGGTDFFAPGWSAKDSENYKWLVFSESAGCQDGKKCQKWENPAIDDLGIAQNIGPLREGVEYRLSLWYKSDKEIKVSLSTCYKGGEGECSSLVSERLPSSVKWKKFEITFTPAEGTAGDVTILRIMSQKGSTSFIDDCFLLPAAEEKELSEGLIWQLGIPDGRSGEFVSYDASEYGRCTWLNNNPCFKSDTNTFTYLVSAPGIYSNVQCPAGISSINYKSWIPPDEVVAGLEIKWNEKESGNRKLEIHTEFFKNVSCGIGDDIQVWLPDGKKTFFQMTPKTEGHQKIQKDLRWQVVFDVKPGENSLVIRNRICSHHHVIFFDYLKLSKTEEPVSLKPVMELKTDKLGSVVLAGEKASLNVDLYNPISDDSRIKYQILDYYKKPVKEEELEIKGNKHLSVNLPSDTKGYYELKMSLLDKEGKVRRLDMAEDEQTLRYAVIEAPDTKDVVDSPFGITIANVCLPVEYRDWERLENEARLAFLAGARWNRIIAFEWRIIEPERGKFKWGYFDRIVEILRRNHFNIMANLEFTPKWASTSTDNTPLHGQARWSMSPPYMDDWAESVKEIVSHYKNNIKYWEIWNEPSYISAYWANGNAKDYYELLKTAYQVIKKTDPEATVLSGGLTAGGYSFFKEVLSYGADKYFDVHAYHYSSRYLRQKWRELLDKYGRHRMLNSEQTIIPYYTTCPEDEERYTENFVKFYISEIAGGSERLFTFCTFDTMHNRQGIMRIDMTPRPVFAAFRTMTHQLEGSKYRGKLNIAPGTLAYLFIKGNEPVVAAWNDFKDIFDTEPLATSKSTVHFSNYSSEEKDVSLNVGTDSVEVINLMDVGRKTAAKNGILSVNLTPEPLFIRGGDAKILTFQTGMELNPSQMDILEGTQKIFSLNIENTFDEKIRLDVNLQKPEGWNIALSQENLSLNPGEKVSLKIEVNAPADSGHRQYRLPVNLTVKTGSKEHLFTTSALITSHQLPPGENLIKNPGFEESSDNGKTPDQWWLRVSENGKMEWDNTQGQSGKACLHGISLNDKGCAQFSYEKKIPVIPGEGYVISLWAKGSSLCKHNGMQVSAFNSEGRRIAPEKDGANCLMFAPKSYWKKFLDIYSVPKGASEISLYFSTCWQSPCEIFIDDLEMRLLSEELDLAKIEYTADAVRTTKPIIIDGSLDEWKNIPLMEAVHEENVRFSEGFKWGGIDDLSTKVYAMWDDNNLYLAFQVKDDVFCQPHADFYTYKGDSVQFALNPILTEKDYNEFCLAETPEGPKIYRGHIFATPEQLQTMYVGIVKEGEFKTKKTKDGMNYEVRIPITSLYPLKLSPETKFGFSWLVNDNDGKGRKGWMEWSSGIGDQKMPDQYGLMTCK